MKIVIKPSKELLFLIGGSILLIAGLIGIYFVFNQSDQNSQIGSGDVSGTSTAQYDSSLIVPAKNTPTPFSSTAESTVTPITSASPQISTLHFDKFFVHAAKKSGLDNPAIPDRIEIPAIGLVAPVVIADFNYTKVEGETFGQWQAPNSYNAGWQPDSATLGRIGNTVINGHHNEYGEVFGRLVDLKIGDIINVYSNNKLYSFIIANRMILQERGMDTNTRLQNARWLARTDDIRLTLVTCWPKISNTHRLILVARPVN